MLSTRIIATLLYRIFLLSLIAAVLWVKGYLWWILGIAVFLYLLNAFMNLPIGFRREDDEDDEDEDEDSDVENNGNDKAPF
ncbi:MAG: hypothetical protein ACLQIB_08670 [Isosphaeraceae bacterium]